MNVIYFSDTGDLRSWDPPRNCGVINVDLEAAMADLHAYSGVRPGLVVMGHAFFVNFWNELSARGKVKKTRRWRGKKFNIRRLSR